MWVEFINNQFLVTDIKENGNASLTGIKPGMIITHFNDTPIKDAIKRILPKSFKNYDKKVYDYAVNMIMAGTHNKKRKITLLYKNNTLHFYPDDLKNIQKKETNSILESTVLKGSIGYIKINNSLGDNDLILKFRTAVDELSNTKSMILDLRNTPGGGNTTIARAIMGKFITSELPYQKHSFPAEEKQYNVKRSWIEYVSPSDSVYTKPLIVLVGRWTGSMGEGIAIGFDGMKRGRIIGTKMAGLLGPIECFSFPETHIKACFPIEKLFHIDGTPREDFIPEYLVNEGLEALTKAITLLNKQLD